MHVRDCSCLSRLYAVQVSEPTPRGGHRARWPSPRRWARTPLGSSSWGPLSSRADDSPKLVTDSRSGDPPSRRAASDLPRPCGRPKPSVGSLTLIQALLAVELIRSRSPELVRRPARAPVGRSLPELRASVEWSSVAGARGCVVSEEPTPGLLRAEACRSQPGVKPGPGSILPSGTPKSVVGQRPWPKPGTTASEETGIHLS